MPRPDGIFSYLWVIHRPAALGAFLLLVLGNRTNAWGHYLATVLPIGSFVLAAMMWLAMLAEARRRSAGSSSTSGTG